jgi:hypothetical protein
MPAAFFAEVGVLPESPAGQKGATHASHGLAREGQPRAGGSAQCARLSRGAPSPVGASYVVATYAREKHSGMRAARPESRLMHT